MAAALVTRIDLELWKRACRDAIQVSNIHMYPSNSGLTASDGQEVAMIRPLILRQQKFKIYIQWKNSSQAEIGESVLGIQECKK